MSIHPSLLNLLIGFIYILGFGAVSLVRRQGLSLRFAVEGLIVTAVGAAASYAGVSFHPLLLLIVLYLITMRVRLLVDLGNWFTSRGQHRRAQSLYRFALRLWPDAVGRQIVLINRGVSELGMREPETACRTLEEALACENVRLGAKYLAAGYYNLGLACRRTGREAEAIRHFNEAIDAYPHSIYGVAARRALEEQPPDEKPGSC
jgi:tetratricopeptide (TPR) repeat protein